MTRVQWNDNPNTRATIYTQESSEEYRGYKLIASDDHGRLIDITKDGKPIEGLGRFTKFNLAKAAIDHFIATSKTQDVTNQALPEVQAN